MGPYHFNGYALLGTAVGTEFGRRGTAFGKVPATEFPVELSSFSALIIGSSIKLNWKTETEVSNYGFEVERQVLSSQSSVDKYEKIGFVNGNGNSNSPKNYSFTDSNPIGGSKFQYRLKQIDNDGQFEYSKTIEVDFNSPKIFGLSQNYPNPFNPSTKISWQLPVSSYVSLKIYDILGNELITLVNEQKEAGYYEINFNGSAFTSGFYVYRLTAGDFVSTKKMLMIK